MCVLIIFAHFVIKLFATMTFFRFTHANWTTVYLKYVIKTQCFLHELYILTDSIILQYLVFLSQMELINYGILQGKYRTLDSNAYGLGKNPCSKDTVHNTNIWKRIRFKHIFFR